MCKAIAVSLVSLTLLGAAAGACGQNDSVMMIDEAANNSVIHAKVGQKISLSLPAQFGTGYSWTPTNETKTQMILQAKESTESHGKAGLQPGGTEAQNFQFVAVKEGITVLHYAYAQPWMHNTKPAKEFLVKIIIEKNQKSHN